jgi:hypothetical protein
MKNPIKFFAGVSFIVTLFYANLATDLAYAKKNDSIKIPTVRIFYAAIFDEVCSQKTSYKIEPAWKQELNNRLPQWQKLWNQEGTQLLKQAIKIVGKAFPQNNFSVPLSVCSFPSMSTPLIVNVRYSLKSFTEHPNLDDVTISTIDHELLHNYIDSFLPKETPLLIKYKSEPKMVLSHLHLFALQKATYLALGWQSKLKDVIAKDKSLPNSDYKRAWEIVNEKENYSAFIEELKSSLKK